MGVNFIFRHRVRGIATRSRWDQSWNLNDPISPTNADHTHGRLRSSTHRMIRRYLTPKSVPELGSHAVSRVDSRADGHAITISVYDRGMPVSVNVQTVHPRKLAAVRCEVAPGAVGSAWGPALEKVWEFIRSQQGLWTDGHNIFLYHHPTKPGAPILCDFGVEVTRMFEAEGE